MEEIDRATRSSAEEGFFSGCPVQSIREEKENGEEVYIGEVRLARTTYFNILDGEEAKRLEKVNSEKPVGDPEIEWAFGGKRDIRVICRLKSAQLHQITLHPHTTGEAS